MNNKPILQMGAIVCHEVAIDGAPILYAERSAPQDEADSGWQFLCGSPNENWPSAQVWAIHEILAREKTLGPYVELPAGAVLSRISIDSEWKVARQEGG